MYDMGREEILEEAYKKLHRVFEVHKIEEVNVFNILYYTVITNGFVS